MAFFISKNQAIRIRFAQASSPPSPGGGRPRSGSYGQIHARFLREKCEKVGRGFGSTNTMLQY